MKLFGNKKNGRYAPKGRKYEATAVKTGADSPSAAPAGAKGRRTLLALKIVFFILVVILALLVTLYVLLKVTVKPPDVNPVPKPTVSGGDITAAPSKITPEPTEQPVRITEKKTLAILGMDDGFGNTDTIMVATFDATEYTLNVVSIPRDTLVNVSWPVKKANAMYAYGKIDGVMDGLTDLLGYRVDKYVKISLKAFSKLVNAIGGVYFDVPKNMDYEDPSQNLYIHLRAGPQTLDGSKALQLVRARKNVWATGDIGRIEMQQAFLKAAIRQILEKKDTIKISTLIDIFLNDVDTNLTEGNLAWYAKELLKMDADNVSFDILPANYNDVVNGDSYCTIKVPEWLEIINTKLNPFDHEIKEEDLSILTRGADGKLYVTDGNWAGKKSWGSGGSSSSARSGSPESSREPSDPQIPDESPAVGQDDNQENIQGGLITDSDGGPIGNEESAPPAESPDGNTSPDPGIPAAEDNG